MLKVSPIDGKTKHIDEVAGEQTLPSDFQMMAVAPVTDNISSTDKATPVTVNLTPFSHQEVKAAEKANGGLTADNLQKAKVVVTELYGFDPVQVKQDDKKLNVILAAVSQMVKNNSLGCTDQSTACVVDKMAQATSHWQS